MTIQGSWHNHPKSRPQDGNSYLIHVNQSAAIRGHLGGLPPFVIAKFNLTNLVWSLNGALIPTTFPESDIIEWHEIPQGLEEKP